jgi:RNA polymerase sigma-70 factor (ECF subfamily)
MTTMTSFLDSDEQVLLESARNGDEDAYRELIETHRSELHAHCYRMLASVDDADDAVQDTLLRAWRGLDRFEGRSSVRTWLFKIATNAALDVSKGRARRAVPVGIGHPSSYGGDPDAPLVDTLWVEPYPSERYVTSSVRATPEARYESRESLELAFVVALQLLPANQRAVLILREVVGYSAFEIAALLNTTVAAVNSSLQRARSTARPLLPAVSQQSVLCELGDVKVRALAQRFCNAIEEGDTVGLLALLTENATWSMPPLPRWYQGLASIEAFHIGSVAPQRWRRVAVRANCQLAIAGYIFDDDRQCFAAAVIDVLTLEGDRISSVTAFLSMDLGGFVGADVFPRFGLPLELPA